MRRRRRRGAYRRGRRMKMYRRPYASKRTGYLSIVQQDLSQSFTLPALPGGYPTGFIRQFKFNISQVVNLPELTRLFDQYRIRAVSLRMMPQTNTDDTVFPSLTYAASVDLDGGNIANWADILACSNAKVSNWASNGGNVAQKSHYLKPRWRNTHVVDPTTTPVTYGNTMGNRNQWLDLADQGNTDHFGLNVGFLTPSGVGTAVEQEVTVIIKYYIQFRKIR